MMSNTTGFRLPSTFKVALSFYHCYNKVANMGALLSIPLLAVPSMGTVSLPPYG